MGWPCADFQLTTISSQRVSLRFRPFPRRTMSDYSVNSPQSVRHPDLSDFSFFGFDSQTSRLERNVQRVEIRSSTPRVSVIDDFLYVPMDQTGLLRRDREALTRGEVASPSTDST